ncbi:uncharacterized protein J3D65DRAFT_109221 [Phyllosticta citribraziliensis]|uniref:Uncharacterized protein n=1 Tax=Phyllosticta citribraziliensis TaxID=989973 RepID=A0ABR1LBB9_9PEZI
MRVHRGGPYHNGTIALSLSLGDSASTTPFGRRSYSVTCCTTSTGDSYSSLACADQKSRPEVTTTRRNNGGFSAGCGGLHDEAASLREGKIAERWQDSKIVQKPRMLCGVDLPGTGRYGTSGRRGPFAVQLCAIHLCKIFRPTLIPEDSKISYPSPQCLPSDLRAPCPNIEGISGWRRLTVLTR